MTQGEKNNCVIQGKNSSKRLNRKLIRKQSITIKNNSEETDNISSNLSNIKYNKS